jgi:hypothetical protein
MKHARKTVEQTFGRSEQVRIEKLQAYVEDVRELLANMQQEYPDGGGWELMIKDKIKDAARQIAELELLKLETAHGFTSPLDKV